MPAGNASLASLEHVQSRTLRRLAGYWFEKRGAREMPSLGDIDPAEIPWALGEIWLCDYLADEDRFRVRLAGEKINAFWGQSIAGKYLDTIVPQDRLGQETEKVGLVRGLPAIVHDRVCLTMSDEIAQSGERIILPLSEDGETVNALLGASNCGWLRDLEFDPYVTCRVDTTVTALRSLP